jgi:hypothetical protein
MAARHRRHLDDDQARRRRAGEGGMTTYSLTLRDDHEAQLCSHLPRGDGCEHAAYLICNLASIRFMVGPLAHILKNRQSRLLGALHAKIQSRDRARVGPIA